MAQDIFISYAHPDESSADAVCAALEERGFSCWIAHRDIPPSANWVDSIVAALEPCRLLVLIFSAHTNASIHVPRELEIAVSKRIPTLPMFLEDCAPSLAIGYLLGASQRFYAVGQPFEKHLTVLANQVSLILGAGAPSSSIAPPLIADTGQDVRVAGAELTAPPRAANAHPDTGRDLGASAAIDLKPFYPAKLATDIAPTVAGEAKQATPPAAPTGGISALPRGAIDPAPVQPPKPPPDLHRKAAIIGGGIAAAVSLLTFLVFLSVGPAGAVVMAAGAGLFAWLIAGGVVLSVLER